MAQDEEAAKVKVEEKVPFYKLFTFADHLDMTMMIIGVISAMANGMSQPLMSLIFGKMINAFGSTDPSHIVQEVSKVALLFVYVAFGAGITSFLQVSCWMMTGERQAARIRGLYLKTILKQDITFFDTETTTGEVIGRMSGDTILIQDAMGEKVGKFIQLVSAFFGGFVIAFTKGWELCLVLLACIPCIVVVGGIMSMMMAKMSTRGQAAYAEAGIVVEQTVGAIRTVASFTGEKKAIEKYNNKLRIAYATTVQQGLASGFGMGVLLLIIFCTYALAMWYGSKLIIEKGYDGGSVFNIIMSINTGGMSLGQAAPCVNAFAAGQAAAYKMFETIKRKPKIDAYDTNGVVLEEIRGDIELKDVHFRYPARPDVQIFSGFSFYIPSGKTAAFVGQSGSGKSTIISLLERFYDPEAGEVLIDGVNLKNFQGIDTMVGGHGTQLSGGQKQRIAIARAILKNPRILLLDEATSALDAESERIVQEALEKVMSQRTTVVVAHRLTTIRNADIIAVIHQGKIVEKGTHDELIKDADGSYSQLIRLQEGNKGADVSRKSEADKSNNNSFNLDSHMARSLTKRTSFARSISQGSTSSRHSLSLGLALPYQIPLHKSGEGDNEDVESSEVDNKKNQKVPINRLAKLNKPEVPVLLLGSIAAAIHGAILPIFGLLLSSAINTFYKPPNELRKDSEFWSLLFVGLGVVTLVAIPVQNYLFGIAGGKLIERICSLTFNKVVHQEISWFDRPSNSRYVEDFSGAVSARLATGASTVRSLVGDTLALIVQNIATVSAGLVIAFTANWILAFVILAVSPLLLIQGYLQTKFVKGFSADAKVMYEEASQVATDAVGSIRTVASFCAEPKVMEMYRKKCSGPEKQGVRLGLVSGAGLGFSFVVLYCTNAFCFYIGSILVQHGKATFGEVFKVFFALTITAVGVSQSSALAPDTNKAKDSAASIFEILDSKPAIDSSSDEGTTLDTVKGEIELQQVSFCYPTRPNIQIFKDMCLTMPTGKTVALVGESGSGKSTVISLLERFYNPDSGRILIDGVDIKEFKLNWLRQQMGLVGQEPILFNDSIRANIAYSKEGGATEEEIIAAAQAANAHKFISSLPHGYDTSVGERGTQLSGGQKQRIAIARAILKDPRILLLDEATSALDAESEGVVQEALDRVSVNRTTVVIAHRLTTIKGADIIAVVKNGAIAEKGGHDALMKIDGGVYASLVALHTKYVGVGESEDVQAFYYFIESENNPKKDPLMLWLTGGPGCSALSGLVFEIGPLTFKYEEYNGSLPNLVLRPHSWTKGYLLGNAATTRREKNYQIPFAHGMGLISDELYGVTSGLNSAHILDPSCEWLDTETSWRRSLLKKYPRKNFLNTHLKLAPLNCRSYVYFLCGYWANDDNVRTALHIRKGSIGKWHRCTFDIPNKKDISSSYEYHVNLSRKGYRSLIYSGDHDMTIPFLATQAWIRSLNYSIVDEWRQWHTNGQVAGYTRTYSNRMTFATVKASLLLSLLHLWGGGHTAPEYKPDECFAMFSSIKCTNFLIKQKDFRSFNMALVMAIGERGTQLSCGQKPCITIARAILKDPRILLFDDATSTLDARIRGVQEALDRMSQ
ncbi:hypothetical protein JHK82_036976 [Glycine max]|nr:hypothetical protein JHK82_036976 [Glycine max]